MRVSSQRWASTLFISLTALFLTACVEITAVSQPTSGLPGVPFQVEIVGTLTSPCQDGNTCTPVGFVSLPAGWVVNSCSYTGDLSGNCSANAISLPALTPPTNPGNTWTGFTGQPFTPPAGSELAVGSTATVTLQITPASAGIHALDYVLGRMTASNGASTGAPSMNHKITIGSPATAIPTLSTYGYALAALGIAGLALLQRRKLMQG